LEIAVQQDSSAMRFELLMDGHSRGFVEYYVLDHVVIVTHTEVDPRCVGKGYGSKVARQALDYFRGENKQVVPICGFFAHQIRRYPEYTDLVTVECRRIFNL
jgi:predicted GNAT family acetyltransferase